VFSQIWEATTANWRPVLSATELHPTKSTSSLMYIVFWYCTAFLRCGSTIRIHWTKMAIFKLYARKYLANGISNT